MTRSPGQIPVSVDPGHSHHVDALIDPSTQDVYVPPSGVQQVRLLGPFNVAHDHPDIAGNFGIIRLTELGANAVVANAWAIMREPWDALDSVLSLHVSDTPDGQNLLEIARLNVTPDDSFNATDAIQRQVTSGSWAAFVDGAPQFYVGSAGPDGAWLVASLISVDPTQGEVDIYALIAEPAS